MEVEHTHLCVNIFSHIDDDQGHSSDKQTEAIRVATKEIFMHLLDKCFEQQPNLIYEWLEELKIPTV